ncbi:MAG: crosslink repair DNA glycosylase YcaQ family protein [Pigmentiphaga sp.]|uniref:winged helix-turn-helix domain-containing protein n=1 Tax=Pigmentiphaga sp. TaxID=1977564 RepID=UPI0029AA3E88|nr:crosslink repair DNA glycosylase YcaQ family protein [Pigmentiphaga sp.]MDX3906186.1 crosslink repair DNA glycosylase YcaQ family protein [Pigmentiphaga sp.]
MPPASHALSPSQARAIWLRAQRLDAAAPFGAGPDAVRRAVEHLGYVQIDTIHVIERCHHHILYTRIPAYRRTDLEQAQSGDKTVFEYWTHALAYVPTADYRQFVAAMDRRRAQPGPWISGVPEQDYAALLRRIRNEGPLSIRDIDDDVLVEKTHPWASRKPSKRALRLGFFVGDLAVSKRTGMLKTYDLARRHFGWQRRPRPVGEEQSARYLLQRALRSQGMVSLESACYGDAAAKPGVRAVIDAMVKKKQLVPVHIDGLAKAQHWIAPADLEASGQPAAPAPVHILSPFDPLIIQRKRLQAFFGYEHRFEAYVPADKRVLGYFALPVLVGDVIVAALDLKMDRKAGRLLVQKWTWVAKARPAWKAAIEEALDRFEQFQRS